MTNQQYEQQIRAAERQHDLTNELGKRILDAAARDAQEAMKVALLINGGAAVAVLAFMSAVVSRGGFSFADVKAVGHSLYWFIGGIVAAAVTAGCAYLCNSLYAAAHFEKEKLWEYPYVEDTSVSLKKYRWARGLNWAAVLCAAGALFAFVVGVFVAADAIANLSR